MAKEKVNKTEMKRKVISLETKIEILNRLRNKQRIVDVAKFYSMNEATIRTIKKNEDSIRKSVAAGMCTSMSTISHVRNVAMENMEKALIIWLEEQNQKKIPVYTKALKNKALEIYEQVQNQAPSSVSAKKKSFHASHGWFERFKQRHSLYNLKQKGQQTSVSEKAAEQYPQTVAEIIDGVEASYSPDPLFHTDESAITANAIRDGIVLGRQLGNYFHQYDPNVERAYQFQQDLNKLLTQYEVVYEDMTENKTQMLITDFFSENSHRTTPTINTAIVKEEPNEIILTSNKSDTIRKRRRSKRSNSN